jgi:hypothetical protein
MVDEGIDFENAASEVAAFGENALLQGFHSHAPHLGWPILHQPD